jgi:hypothetical protein
VAKEVNSGSEECKKKEDKDRSRKKVKESAEKCGKGDFLWGIYDAEEAIKLYSENAIAPSVLSQ